jgi:lipid II isoglutaminyl synthase (glutamine-hydrolysing)
MPISLRRATAALAGKAAHQLSRRLRFGGGTTLPGHVARRLAPNILRELSATLSHGVVLVSGTNGKTTTARMLSTILAAHGWQVLHNRAGANLLSGLTATAVAGTDLLGQLRTDVAIFETDEAHVPAAIAETNPRVVLALNLFRDQLDRYGEVDTIARRWRAALAKLPPTTTVVLNADDPGVAGLGEDLTCRVIYYGLEDLRHGAGAARHVADSAFCRRCGTPLNYNPAFYGHIGHYRCPNCGLARPEPQIQLMQLELHATDPSLLKIQAPEGNLRILLPIPGLYNGLNALAAAAVALQLGIAPTTITSALQGFTAAFGRIERFRAGEREVLMALIKNPIGASETIRMLAGDQTPAADDDLTSLHLLIVINDKTADGTDVSWLWDADFERLAGRVAHAVVAGTRAWDMAVRLKYAGVDPGRIETISELAPALDRALRAGDTSQPLFLLPTYTAMLEMREVLVGRGYVRPFWES